MKFEIVGRVNASALREAIVLMHVGATTKDRIIEITGALETDQILNHFLMSEIPFRRFSLIAFSTQSASSAEKEIAREIRGQSGKVVYVFDRLGNASDEWRDGYQRCVAAAISAGHSVVTITYDEAA